jgi:predicted anti-sigma-YlaC factor YlaD
MTAGRMCTEVQHHLPAYVDGRSLSAVRRRLLRVHLKRCDVCRAALAAQEDVAAGLAAMGRPGPPPPEGLLDTLLSQAASPGLAGRAAVPARGAVSGARPALSLALLVAGAAAGTGLGYAGWRGARVVRGAVRRRW